MPSQSYRPRTVSNPDFITVIALFITLRNHVGQVGRIEVQVVGYQAAIQEIFVFTMGPVLRQEKTRRGSCKYKGYSVKYCRMPSYSCRVLSAAERRTTNAERLKCYKEMLMEQGQSRIKVEYGIDVTIVTFNDERIVDEEQIRELQESFKAVIEKNDGKKLILNFANVRFMTSAFLGLLVRVHKKLCEQGGRLRLSNLDSNLRKVFEITQLTKVFEIS
jgi:anti-anti-sigma factor